ncbi:LamG-like jellyroll fold domain-containing protein [Roseixanthobacter glucoisosaccharinicivorans]|uniref:LamG-like jellyroll fold domain-containing protein n=1 Tax=Roseixanthobacter glucoisosaccharinicivorans TaxID=3119923 RepID=UPI00372C7658
MAELSEGERIGTAYPFPRHMAELGRSAIVDVAIMLITFCVVVAAIWPVAFLEIDPHHDGLMLKVANDVAHGAVPFRDSFSQYGLLIHLFHGMILAAFGVSLKTLLTVTVIFYGMTGVLLLLLWGEFIDRWMAFICVIIWVLLGPFYLFPLLPWASSMALVPQVAAMLFAVRYWKSGAPGFLVSAAFCGVLTFWIRMPVGLLVVAALFSVFLLSAVVQSYLLKRRFLVEMLSLVIGAAAGIVPFGLYLILTGSLKDWFLQNIVMAVVFGRTLPAAWGTGEGLLHSIINGMIPYRLNLIWVALPVAAVLTALAPLCRFVMAPEMRRSSEQWQILTLGALCVASWAQYYPVSEERHVFWASSPMIGVLCLVVCHFVRQLLLHLDTCSYRRFGWRVADRAGLVPSVMALSVLIGFAIHPVAQRLEGAFLRSKIFTQRLQTPSVLAGMYTTPQDARILSAMEHDVKEVQEKYPSKAIINVGYDPLSLNFGKYNPNWHPLFVYYDIGVSIYPDFPSQLGKYIRKNKPIILTSGYNLEGQGYRVIGHYKNGLSLLAPGKEDTDPVLGSGDAEPSHPLVQASVLNRFNLESPMRVTGHRFPAVSLGSDATIEILLIPSNEEGPHSHVLGNLYGPDPLHGFEVRHTSEQGVYNFTVGSNGVAINVLTFRLMPNVCNYVVIRRRQDLWEAWVDGRIVDRRTVASIQLTSKNQLIANNSMLRAEYYYGLIEELRIVNRALTSNEIALSAELVRNRCQHANP